MSRRVIIVGAGPGGLTAAVALRRAGLVPLVFEGSRPDRAHGSALTLWPNALRALETLGLAGEVLAAGRALRGIAMYRWNGETLFSIPADAMIDHFGSSGLTILRADLVAILARAAGADTVRYGRRGVDFEETADGVTCRFDDTSAAAGDCLIGADGTRSVIRDRLFGPSDLRYAGCTVWRGVSGFELERDEGVTTMGSALQFGYFPLPGGRVYWFACATAPEGGRDPEGSRKGELGRRFAGWHAPIPAILKAADEANILRNDVYDLDPLSRWGRGRVSLLGDAAHPCAPTLGQGACQAVEDAVVLARCLRDAPEVADALRDYAARRSPRTRSITLQSRAIARAGNLRNRSACWLRDWLIRRTPGRERMKHLHAMFQFD